MTAADLETALEFLKTRVKATPLGTIGNLNQLPYSLYEAVAKVMHEYAASNQVEWETVNERTVKWDKEQTEYLRQKLGTEPCTECGEDYPRLDLLAGHILCPLCRKGGSVGVPD